MSNEEILKLIGDISPHAEIYVNEGFKNNEVDIMYAASTNENTGVFLKVDEEDCCIFYANFSNENNIEKILELIDSKVKEYLSTENSKEICFNVHGSNSKIISLVRKLGFKTDMQGYHLEFQGKQLPDSNNCNLIDMGFQESMLKEFCNLFDKAYYQLYMDNGWEVNSYSRYQEPFKARLISLDKLNQVHSFWIDNELAGAYIFQDNYITDIVVNPVFQNKGYGSYMLAHCIKNMKIDKDIKNIRLRVAKSNVGAKKLYERNGFVEIACFAEHTYC